MERFGPYGEPAVILNYGASGLGKSVDLLRTFPTGLFLAPPGGVKPAYRELGFSPLAVPVRTFFDVQRVVQEVRQQGADKWEAVVVDDATIVAQATFAAMEDSGQYRTSSGYKDSRGVYRDLGQLIIRIRDDLRHLGLHVGLNFHEREPSTDDKGQFWKGGPMLPSRAQTVHIPHIGDLVLRARESAHRMPWKGVAECDPDNVQWTEKDRFGVAPKSGPLNSGELLRAAGYPLRRAPGCEWLDPAAERIAEDAAKGDRLAVMQEWAIKLLGAAPLPLARWAIQDGLDRAEIRSARAAQDLAKLGVVREADGGLRAGAGQKQGPFG